MSQLMVIFIICKEWSLLDGLLKCIFVIKIYSLEYIHPIVLMIVDEIS